MASQRFVRCARCSRDDWALADAVDKRDPYTARPASGRGQENRGRYGQVMRVNDAELEALEWWGCSTTSADRRPGRRPQEGDRLTREERIIMNSHPVLVRTDHLAGHEAGAGAADSSATTTSGHNGSGYPDRLIGDEIPQARADPPRRRRVRGDDGRPPLPMTPLRPRAGARRAARSAGVQFDPVMVDAFVRTRHADGVADPGRNRRTRPPDPAHRPGAERHASHPSPGPRRPRPPPADRPNEADGTAPARPPPATDGRAPPPDLGVRATTDRRRARSRATRPTCARLLAHA